MWSPPTKKQQEQYWHSAYHYHPIVEEWIFSGTFHSLIKKYPLAYFDHLVCAWQMELEHSETREDFLNYYGGIPLSFFKSHIQNKPINFSADHSDLPIVFEIEGYVRNETSIQGRIQEFYEQIAQGGADTCRTSKRRVKISLMKQ